MRIFDHLNNKYLYRFFVKFNYCSQLQSDMKFILLLITLNIKWDHPGTLTDFSTMQRFHI